MVTVGMGLWECGLRNQYKIRGNRGGRINIGEGLRGGLAALHH